MNLTAKSAAADSGCLSIRETLACLKSCRNRLPAICSRLGMWGWLGFGG